VFQESLHGLVRAVDVELDLGVRTADDGLPAPPDDRLECALAAEHVLAASDGAGRGCILADLKIAVDVGTEAADGGLVGVVRSGLVYVEGLPTLTVQHGEFELFPRAPGDARRMRYRMRLREPDGSRWFLRGTKLVVGEVAGGPVRRVWAETTTLYVVLAPLPAGSPDPAPRPVCYAGVVRVRPLDLLRQLGSLRGEPGPAGGLRAVRRLGRAFWSVIAEVYLHGGSTTSFAPGIEVAFGEPPNGSAPR
jgi:hypothetical protein